jgi:hypothetical protein
MCRPSYFLGLITMILNQHQTEAIATSDAHTNNVGLPTYSNLLYALERANNYLADLNGSNWFKDDVASLDMKQRAKATHQLTADTLFRP